MSPSTRIMRWPAIAWLAVIAGSLVFLIALGAPWWAFLLWGVPATIFGPNSVKGAFRGYEADSTGIPMSLVMDQAMKGAAVISKWLCEVYDFVRMLDDNPSTGDLVARAITMRYGDRDPDRERTLMLAAENGSVLGLAHFAVLALLLEGESYPEDAQARQVIHVIVSALAAHGIPHEHIATIADGTSSVADEAALDRAFEPLVSVLRP